MTWIALPAALLAMLLAGAAAPLAQSLADVARREEARRKTIQTPGKVYTNESLRPAPPPSTPPAAAAPPAAPASPAAPETPGTPPAAGAPPPQTPGQPSAGQPAAPATQGEAEWRKRIAGAREALTRAQTFAEAIQTRINVLSADFVNRDDPAQRDMIDADRQKALAELDRLKQEIQDHQKSIAAIQDEARRAGVPAGWVR